MRNLTAPEWLTRGTLFATKTRHNDPNATYHLTFTGQQAYELQMFLHETALCTESYEDLRLCVLLAEIMREQIADQQEAV